MIIVKTKNGDRFINDKAVTMVEHDREKAVVDAYGDNGVFFHIEDVEGIVYTNDAQPTSWKDVGSALEKVRKDNERMFDIIERLRQEKQAVKDDLLHFACNMEQIVCNYHAELPDYVRRQIQQPSLKYKSKVLNHGYDTQQ